jgi:phosphoenolpyruvate carboxylase
VREQEGAPVFEIVERVRQTAVRFARDGDPAARAELAALLDPLPRDTTQIVVRAFSYFLQLANIAEDEHHIRRRRAYDLAGSPPREGSLVFALDALADRKPSRPKPSPTSSPTPSSPRCSPPTRPKSSARA